MREELPVKDADRTLEGNARIKVVGVGGGGSNARQPDDPQQAARASSSSPSTPISQALNSSEAPLKMHIGRKLTRGLGAGGNPSVGQDAAEESREELQKLLADADMVFVTAGMGGGTGTGAAPVIAEIVRAAGRAHDRRGHQALPLRGRAPPEGGGEGIGNLQSKVDTLITIPNERLTAGHRQEDDDHRRLPDRRRRAAPGRPGHLRPDHLIRA